MSLPVRLVSTVTADDLALQGAFLEAEPVPRAASFDVVLWMHGVANNFVTSLTPGFAEGLAAHGYPSLRVNNRGHDVVSRGSKTQPYLGAAFERIEDSVLDWGAWFAWLGARGYRRILVCGHSLGGVKTAHVLASGDYPLVAGCVLLSPPRFSHARWMASARAAEFQAHLDLAQKLVDAGTPDALFAVTMPIPFISAAASYIAKYGPGAHFDVFENIVRIGVPVVGFTGDQEFENVEFRDHPDEYAKAALRKRDLIHHVVPDGNHYYYGQEAWVTERLLAWMREVAPAA
jgi:pimeloyl-ACP methyl ester carboxylesterase